MPLSEPLRIVAIGGGTGLSALLNGLKKYTHGTVRSAEPVVDLTAIVTVTDDGGSSGRLRRDFDVLPPGDIRNCMVALSEDGDLLAQLFRYRFQAGRGLKGHSFGNLFLTALTEITGDFPDAVRKSCEVLKIAGRIYPSTAANVSLEAVLDNGTVVSGETRISRSRRRIAQLRLLPRGARPLKAALEAIARADLITLGPGSLFTSVIPNVLVTGMPAAIRKSPAMKAYFVNLMSQPGETTSFAASDHITAIREHAGGKILDCAVVSTSKIPAAVLRSYRAEGAAPVMSDVAAIEGLGLSVIKADLLMRGPKVRHHSASIARVAIELAEKARDERTAKLNFNGG